MYKVMILGHITRPPTMRSGAELVLPPNGRAYGMPGAVAYLGQPEWKVEYERDNMGRLVGVVVGTSHILTEAELDAWREWSGLDPFEGERPAHVQAGPSGVLLTRAGVARELNKPLESITRGIGYFLPVQKVGRLHLYKLEDVETMRKAREG